MLTWVSVWPVSIVFFQCLHKFKPSLLILAFGGIQHPLARQVGKRTDILVALAHTHFIHAHTAHVAEIRLGIGRVHLPEEHPPQPGVRLPYCFGHLAGLGHLAHQQQREGFKLLREMGAQPFPRRTHPEDVAALAALAARQTAGDLATVLENIEMPPGQPLGMIVKKNKAAVFRTARQLP